MLRPALPDDGDLAVFARAESGRDIGRGRHDERRSTAAAAAIFSGRAGTAAAAAEPPTGSLAEVQAYAPRAGNAIGTRVTVVATATIGAGALLTATATAPTVG